MNKTNQSVLFVCYLFWINLLPMLIASFSITNKQAGSISPNAALYQPPVFAAAACIILLPLYWSYRSGRHTHTYFANRNLIPMRKKIVWSATYLGLLFLIGTYGHPVLEWMFGIPPQELENQQAIIEWVRSLPAILVLADVVLVAPLAEEWLFRGILLNIFGDTLQTFADFRFYALVLRLAGIGDIRRNGGSFMHRIPPPARHPLEHRRPYGQQRGGDFIHLFRSKFELG